MPALRRPGPGGSSPCPLAALGDSEGEPAATGSPARGALRIELDSASEGLPLAGPNLGLRVGGAFQNKGRVQAETGRTPENAEAEQAPGMVNVPMSTSTLVLDRGANKEDAGEGSDFHPSGALTPVPSSNLGGWTSNYCISNRPIYGPEPH